MLFTISITGAGSAADICRALDLISNAIKSPEVRAELDTADITDLDGTSFVDNTLLLEISAKPELQ